MSQPRHTEPPARPRFLPAGPLLGQGPASPQTAQGPSPVSPQPQLPLPLRCRAAPNGGPRDPAVPCGAALRSGPRSAAAWGAASVGQRLAFGEAGSADQRSRTPTPRPASRSRLRVGPVQHPGPPPSVSPSRVPRKLSSPAPSAPGTRALPESYSWPVGADGLGPAAALPHAAGARSLRAPRFLIFCVPDALAPGPSPEWASR